MAEVLGGFSAVARALTEATGTEHSRQQVNTWYARRANNGFPQRFMRAGRPVFRVSEVLAWREQYVPRRGGRPRLEEGMSRPKKSGDRCLKTLYHWGVTNCGKVANKTPWTANPARVTCLRCRSKMQVPDLPDPKLGRTGGLGAPEGKGN